MNKYLKLSLPVLFALTTSMTNNLAMVQEYAVSDFNQFAQIIMRERVQAPESRMLICSDIDDTATSYVKNCGIGTEKWFGKVYGGLQTRGVSDPMQVMFFAAIIAHQMNSSTVQLTEPGVVGVYNIIQSTLNIPVIGLTSRTYILSDITKEQLSRLQLRFSSPWPNTMILNTDPTWRAMYKPEDGIVYCSGNNKGDILVKLLEQTKLSIGEQKIDTIVVIDNDEKHLIKIKTAIAQHKMPVNLVLVKYNGQPQASVEHDALLETLLDYMAALSKRSQDAALTKSKRAEKSQELKQPSPKLPNRSNSTPCLPPCETC